MNITKEWIKRDQMIFQMMSLLHSIRVIPLGFEPKTHSLEEYTKKT
nr:hypothetical protein [uncultured Prevotella sp.]